jgi:putative hydrolase of the HAD superfamily
MKIVLSNYKNIIFDLGGVILNIDYSLTSTAFSNVGITNFDDLFSQAQQQQLFDKYEKGLISSSDFRNEIRTISKKNLSDTIIDDAWNAMLLDLPIARLELLQVVKETHRTFLLSNTNDIHIQTLNKYLQHSFNINDFNDYFEKKYLSYEVGMRKPDAEIFEFVLSENNIVPSETLFIDDSRQHIEGAKNVGIHTHWLQKGETILDLFR